MDQSVYLQNKSTPMVSVPFKQNLNILGTCVLKGHSHSHWSFHISRVPSKKDFKYSRRLIWVIRKTNVKLPAILFSAAAQSLQMRLQRILWWLPLQTTHCKGGLVEGHEIWNRSHRESHRVVVVWVPTGTQVEVWSTLAGSTGWCWETRNIRRPQVAWWCKRYYQI